MSSTTFAVKRDELKIAMERTFHAPREVVFKAYTDPNAIPKWWGLRNHEGGQDGRKSGRGVMLCLP